MEYKTFIRRPLDELLGHTYYKLNLRKSDLLFVNGLAITNHAKKKALWKLYMARMRLT